MVQRANEKRKKSAARTSGSARLAASSGSDGGDLAKRVRELEAERDRLKAELDQAQARISMLEEGRSMVVGRIDSVIESLATLSPPRK